MPEKIAHTKEELPKLKEGYVRVVHVTKAPEGSPYLEKVKREGLDYKMYGMLNSVARWWGDENQVEYSIEGDARFSGAGAKAIIMDVPMEEANLHGKIGRAPGIVPSKYLVGILDVSNERKQGKSGLERNFFGLIAIIGLLASIFFLSFNLTGNTISNLSKRDGNVLGIVFFLVGLIGGFFYLRYQKHL